mmetsp:Transcript_1984/g.2156  ORF Transcript_1984/g.2156 Transcript_1984/m.2156 type:complete len:254 (+) Transcript_1984:830-1591(+)
MSSPKDYVLEVLPSSDRDNLIKFTVRHKTNRFFKYLQSSILVGLGTVLASFCFCLISNNDIIIKRFNGNNSTLIQNNQTFSPAIVKLFQDYIDSNDTKTNSFLLNAFIIAIIVILMVIVYSKQEKEDSILIMNDVGIQLNSQSGWKFSLNGNKSHFIPISNIIDLVIHEGFHGYGQVVFYLCVLTKTKSTNSDNISGLTLNNDKMIKIVFPQFLPRKDILMKVWKDSRRVLFGKSKRYWRRVPGQGLKECYQH